MVQIFVENRYLFCKSNYQMETIFFSNLSLNIRHAILLPIAFFSLICDIKANPSISRKRNICHNFYEYKFQIVFCSQIMLSVEQNILNQFSDSSISRNCNTCLRSAETLLCQKCLQLPKILFLLLVENSALSWPN